MFREVARKNKAISRDECIDILKEEKRGILSVIGDDGYPYGMPLNHYYNEDDGMIYFHSGKTGHRTDALRACDKVSFCVYDSGYKNDGEWSLNIRSVIVFGRVVFIEDHDTAIDISRRLSYKFTDDESYIDNEIKRSGRGVMVFAIRPEHITGKLVNEA